jgi:hypothetical protein
MRSSLRILAPLLLVGGWGCVTSLVESQVRPLGPGPGPGLPVFQVGSETFHPTECYSGQREQFFGVDLVDPTRRADLRIAVDPIEGARLRVTAGASAGAEQRMILGEGTCRLFQVDVRPTDWRVNDIQDYDGEVNADCVGGDGVPFQASVSFKHCH